MSHRYPTVKCFSLATLLIAMGLISVATANSASAAPQFPDRVIGKAGGSPIHATEVLQPIYRKLIQVAASTDKESFVKQASQLLAVRVYSITYARLVAYDISRRMPATDRQAFEQVMAAQKKKLVDEWGNGDASVADTQLRNAKGVSLEHVIRNARIGLLAQEMQKALRRHVPKITDGQVDEYYRTHSDEYNVEDSRHIRLIRAAAKDKDAIAAALKAGKPFTEVAAMKANEFRSDRGGDMGKILGSTIFADEGVNKATLALKSGEHSPALTVGEQVWWVHVTDFKAGQAEPTKEQRDAIRKQLDTQYFTLIEKQYRAQLFKTIEHSKMEDMVLNLQNYLIAIHDTANEK